VSTSSSEGSAARDRRSGLAALSGYVGGLGVGTGCGPIRAGLGGGSKSRADIVLALAAMAGCDVPATALGVTDPRRWSLSSSSPIPFLTSPMANH